MLSGQPQPDDQAEAAPTADVALPARQMDLVKQATLMAKVGLPLSDPGDDLQYWYRTDGDISLILLQGVRTDEQGTPHPRGYPSGYYPRRQLIELVTMAARTGNPYIELGSQRQFMLRMNLRPTGGKNGNIAPFIDQLDRLLDSSIAVIPFGNRNVSAKATVRIADAYQLWLERGEERPAGFKEFVRLSDPFFEQVVHHYVDMDEEIIKKLGGRALQLDIYTWLSYWFAYQTEPETFTWEQLRPRLGLQTADDKDGLNGFKRLVRRALAGVLKHLPDDMKQNVTVDAVGVHLSPTARLLVTGAAFAITAEHLALPPADTSSPPASATTVNTDSTTSATPAPTLPTTARRRTKATAPAGANNAPPGSALGSQAGGEAAVPSPRAARSARRPTPRHPSS